MIKKIDLIRYKVYYYENNILKTVFCDSFASAAGVASALNGITRSIDVEALNLDHSSTWSACLYVYSCKDNTRRVANSHALEQVLKYEGVMS